MRTAIACIVIAAAACAREVASSKPRPGQKPVNAAANAWLTKTRDAAIIDSWKRSPGDVEKALVAVWKAWEFPLKNRSIAAVELALERDPAIAPELNYGDLPEKDRVAHPVFAASLLIRKKDTDLSIGLDKFGHFAEEGFFMRQVAATDAKNGPAIAEGVSRWFEGIAPGDEALRWIAAHRKFKAYFCDEDGRKEYDLIASFAIHAAGAGLGIENRSSPADIQANLAGMRFFQDLESLLGKAGKDLPSLEKVLKSSPVDVEDFVTESWDEARNPNVKTLEKAPVLEGR